MRTSIRARRLALVSILCAAAASTACLGDYGNDTVGVGGTGGNTGNGGGGNLTIAAVSGDNQTAPAGSALNDSLVVRVSSPAGAAPGVVVTWAVVAGNGSVSPTSGPTDAQGLARARFATGPTPGSGLVRASISGSAGASVDFRATGQ